MDFKALMQKDFQLPSLPPFRTYRASLGRALLFLLLPNVVFWLFSWHLHLARPLINLDYFIACALILLPLPFYLNHILAGIAFFGVAIFDILMLTMQLFPFMDIGAMMYLAPFILEGPKQYLILTILAVIALGLTFYLLYRFAKKQAPKIVLGLAAFVGLIGYQLRWITYHQVEAEYFAVDSYYVFNSQYSLYNEHYENPFVSAARNQPELGAGQEEYASKRFKQPYSDKVMLVVVESWGVAREESVQRDILKAIYDQADNLEFIEEGFFDFSGATLNGELRELCQMRVLKGGYALGKIDDAVYQNCLPNKLKALGYKTMGMHGASSLLYDRLYWYKKAGMDTQVFVEHVPEVPKCHAFNGACDTGLMDIIAKEFEKNQNNKFFFYWLTLTNHYPYSQTDLKNSRLDCEKHNLFAGDICHNFRLHTQFFDNLGELIKRPEMAGVEVILVGDHMPPIDTRDVPIHKNVRWNDVSWLHFKVKEQSALP